MFLSEKQINDYQNDGVIIIKDVFKDVLKHTHGLGIFEMVKVTGSIDKTEIETVDVEVSNDEELNQNNDDSTEDLESSSQAEDDETILITEETPNQIISAKMWVWLIILVILLGVMIVASSMYKKKPKKEEETPQEKNEDNLASELANLKNQLNEIKKSLK